MNDGNTPQGQSKDAVADLMYRYSMLSPEDRRRFDRNYSKFRAVRNQFSEVFDRMRAARPARQPEASTGAK